MATRAPFLNQLHGGYHHRDVPQEDEELTHVGPGTPCGEYLRRFWHPIARSDELKDLPVAIRIMGEDLVLFRDRSGRVGLLERHCSHRGTSLEFGLICEQGIRCCYHGWHFDVDGRIVDTPGEPPESTLKDRLCHGAYPTHEFEGLVFAYMGPPDKRPDFPMYNTFSLPGNRMVASHANIMPCNWLQITENVMDPVHLSFLHSLEGSVGFAADLHVLGELDFMETPVGSVYIDTRRQEDRIWVRVADWVIPNIQQFPRNVETRAVRRPWRWPVATNWQVPIDDTTTMTIGYQHVPDGQEPRTGAGFGQAADRPYHERQRVPGDYDAQVSQRPIARHGLEHLATTDRGVTLLRKLLRQGIRAVQRGEDPRGLPRNHGQVTFTYGHDVALPIPLAPTVEEEKRLLRETGRKVAGDFIKDPTPPAEVTV